MKTLIVVWNLLTFLFQTASTVKVGTIFNALIRMKEGNPPTSINGSCHQCLCEMLKTSNYFLLNCFTKNDTCQMFWRSDENKTVDIASDVDGQIHFLSMPKENVPAVPTVLPQVTWQFVPSSNDTSLDYVRFSNLNESFLSMSMTGDRSSLLFTVTRNQSVFLLSPTLNLLNQSWTFQARIYVLNLTDTSDFGIIGQCSSATNNNCLHMNIRNRKLFLGFFSNDLSGVQIVKTLRWYHIAFTFDCNTRNRSIYLDGYLDNSQIASICYQGQPVSLTFGMTLEKSRPRYYHGLIDQVSFFNQSRSSAEILEDATLTAHLKFDNQSIHDHGPLGLQVSSIGNNSFTVGRLNDAIQINNQSNSYILIDNLIHLSMTGQAYSFSIWIKPFSLRKSTVLYLSTGQSSTSNWCLPILGFVETGNLLSIAWNGTKILVYGPVIDIDAWTHIALTYSVSNGLQMYINGIFYNASDPFQYTSNILANYLLIGSSFENVACSGNDLIQGQYFGAIDEFQLFSRKLSVDEIQELAY